QGQTLQVQSTLAGDRATIVVDAIGSDGRYVNNATTTAVLASPVAPSAADSATTAPQTITLAQTAPGRYEATVPAAQQGNYLVEVSQTAPGQTTPATQVHGFTVPYSPEFASLPTDYGLLRDLAQRTGGAVLAAPADSFAHNLRLADSARPIWPLLATALVLLFVLDVAVRRLRFGPGDLWPVWAALRARWVGTTGRPPQPAGRLERTRRRAPPAPPRPVPRRVSSSFRPVPSRVGWAAPAMTAGAPGAPTGNRLLAAKRRAAPTPARARR